MGERIVCRFSCGAASAVATKMALLDFGATHEVVVVNAFIAAEDEDNRRFLLDVEKWLGVGILVLRDEKYGADPLEVWRRNRFIVSRQGAACSRRLKRDVLDRINQPNDIMVLGYTVEERGRWEDFVERNPELRVDAPLIRHGLTKSDCFALVERAGIELPRMYRLGYNNANCIGCPKGGMGYWNKIRQDFPERFELVEALQQHLGRGSYFFRNPDGVRFGLRDLRPDQGRYQDEPEMSCSFFCEMADQDIRKPAAGDAP